MVQPEGDGSAGGVGEKDAVRCDGAHSVFAGERGLVVLDGDAAGAGEVVRMVESGAKDIVLSGVELVVIVQRQAILSDVVGQGEHVPAEPGQFGGDFSVVGVEVLHPDSVGELPLVQSIVFCLLHKNNLLFLIYGCT